jgi:hypothetical protein
MTIYIVLGEGGIGQDRYTEVMRAFKSEEAAQTYARRYDRAKGGDYNLHTFYVEPTELSDG